MSKRIMVEQTSSAAKAEGASKGAVGAGGKGRVAASQVAPKNAPTTIAASKQQADNKGAAKTATVSFSTEHAGDQSAQDTQTGYSSQSLSAPDLPGTSADAEEVAADNTETFPVGGKAVDPLDEGATTEPTTLEKQDVDDNAEDTGVAPEMRFPLLDVEPNTITSRNTDDFEINLLSRVKKPKIDYHQLAYESVVGRMAGLKKAYNSTNYGSLEPELDITFRPKSDTRKVWKIDSEALQDVLAEASFGFRKTDQGLANQFKRDMRTFVLPNTSDHGGPVMYKRGLNQYRNEALRKQLTDPDPESVEVQVQNARDAFTLNSEVLYARGTTKLQFKTNANRFKFAPQPDNTGNIPVGTDFRSSQGNYGFNIYQGNGSRVMGFGDLSQENYSGQGIVPGAQDNGRGGVQNSLAQTYSRGYFVNSSTPTVNEGRYHPPNASLYATNPTNQTRAAALTPGVGVAPAAVAPQTTGL